MNSQYSEHIVELAYEKFNEWSPNARISLWTWQNQYESNNAFVLHFCRIVVNEIRRNKLKEINEE